MTDTGVVRTYHDKKKTKLKEEYFKIDGKKEGEYKSYYINGELKQKCIYITYKSTNFYRSL